MSPLTNWVVVGVCKPPTTKLASGRICLVIKPAQYKSAWVGVCARSVGKVAEVGAVPCGASEGVPSAADCAHAAVASNNKNSPVFFMLPPGRTAQRPLH